MPRATVSIGRMVMREDFRVAESADNTGSRTISLDGQESMPRLTPEQIEVSREDFVSLVDSFVPVVFTEKNYLDGFYQVNSASSNVEDWWTDEVKVMSWSTTLQRLGTSSEVDIESRLSGAITRANNFSVVGERTHAPPIGHKAYWAGASIPTSLSRTGEDGTILVYRNLTANVHPRWAVSPADYDAGRVKFLDSIGVERSGTTVTGGSSWTLSNGLVRVKPVPSSGVLEVSVYSGGSWRVKVWDVLVNAVSTGVFDYCTVLRNEYEAITIRLTKSLTPGRTLVDLTLRRGQRIVEMYIQTQTSSTIKIVHVVAEASTLGNGYVVKTVNDADGNRDIVGSALTFDSDIVNGGLSKSSTLTLDAFVGSVVGGGSAVAGDAAVDLHKQYVGMPAEEVRGVRR